MSVRQADRLALELERRVLAAPERVFAAWTRPELVRLWYVPSGLVVAEGDLECRPGAPWHVVMMEQDGTRHEAFGRYREVVSPERLVFTHAWRGSDDRPTMETEITVQFVPEGGATRVVFVQEGFSSAASRRGHREGWESTLDKLETLFLGAARGCLSTMREQANLTRFVVGANLEGISHTESMIAPPWGGNCGNWVLGHLVASYETALRILGRPGVMPSGSLARYAAGTPPLVDPSEALPIEQLLAAWDDACGRIDDALADLTPERLIEPVANSPTGAEHETVESLMVAVQHHQAYHAGQLGLLRRIAGKAGAIA